MRETAYYTLCVNPVVRLMMKDLLHSVIKKKLTIWLRRINFLNLANVIFIYHYSIRALIFIVLVSSIRLMFIVDNNGAYSN